MSALENLFKMPEKERKIESLTLDRVPPDFKNGDPITRMTHDTVVVRSDRYRIWVADLIDPILDAEIVAE